MTNYLLQVSMPVLSKKKVETLTLKVGADAKELFLDISEKEDRSISYVVRELAIRGLVQYLRDDNLKLTSEEESFIQRFSSNLNKAYGENKQPLTQTNKLRPQEITEATGELAAKKGDKKKGAA